MPHVKLRNGAELYYEKHGSGPPLFLVPGLGGDGRFWGDNVAALARQFTVVVHDHRGTARSTLSRIAYSVAQMVDDALQLIDALGFEKVHWCGHSTGGAMGQVLAIEHPGRLDRLVLSSTWARTDAFFRRLFEVRSLMLKELGPAAYLKASALALNMPSWVRDHDADLAAAEARAHETIPEPEIVLSRIAAIVAHDRRAELQKVRAPTPTLPSFRRVATTGSRTGRPSGTTRSSTNTASGPVCGEAKASMRVGCALMTSATAWTSSSITASTPSDRAWAPIHGSQATRTAARRLPGPSAEVSAGLRIAAVTTTGMSRSTSRSSRKPVSSSVSVPCVTITPSAVEVAIFAARAWIWSKPSE